MKTVKVKFYVISGSKKLFDLVKRFDISEKKNAVEWISEAMELMSKLKEKKIILSKKD